MMSTSQFQILLLSTLPHKKLNSLKTRNTIKLAQKEDCTLPVISVVVLVLLIVVVGLSLYATVGRDDKDVSQTSTSQMPTDVSTEAISDLTATQATGQLETSETPTDTSTEAGTTTEEPFTTTTSSETTTSTSKVRDETVIKEDLKQMSYIEASSLANCLILIVESLHWIGCCTMMKCNLTYRIPTYTKDSF